MDSYVVRVVRRQILNQEDIPGLDGVVEQVEGGERRAFHNADELWAILADTGERELPISQNMDSNVEE